MISLVFLYCFCFQFHRFLLLLLFLSLGFIFFFSLFFYVKFFYGEIVEAVPPAGFWLAKPPWHLCPGSGCALLCYTFPGTWKSRA